MVLHKTDNNPAIQAVFGARGSHIKTKVSRITTVHNDNRPLVLLYGMIKKHREQLISGKKCFPILAELKVTTSLFDTGVCQTSTFRFGKS